MKTRVPAFAFILAVAIASPVALGQHVQPHQQKTDDGTQIIAIMMKEFDRPEARLKVQPVVVDGDVAIASWAQDGRGGRALLRRSHGAWKIALCSGESLRHENGLKQLGLAPDVASRMAAAVSRAETSLPRETIALFDSFEGTVVITEGGSHPLGHGNSSHGHGAHR